MMEFIVIVLLIALIAAVLGKRSHPAQLKGLAGILAERCPSCRVHINYKATHCPHCAQPTGFAPRPTHWDKLKARRWS
jgi:hypothetical protein